MIKNEFYTRESTDHVDSVLRIQRARTDLVEKHIRFSPRVELTNDTLDELGNTLEDHQIVFTAKEVLRIIQYTPIALAQLIDGGADSSTRDDFIEAVSIYYLGCSWLHDYDPIVKNDPKAKEIFFINLRSAIAIHRPYRS